MTTSEWTILKLLDWTTAYFTEHGVPGPRLDAELLLGDVLHLKRIDLYLNFERAVATSDLARFKSLVQRRAKRQPLQYILEYVEFFGRRFQVTPEVLIPRPETEQLVARALEWLDAHPSATQVLDFGTGSGCIAITLALERPALQVTAVDVSETALRVARENAGALGVNVNFAKSVFSPPPPGEGQGEGEVQLICPLTPTLSQGERGFELIMSNPPYIPSGEIIALQPEVSRFEPRLALDGGEDGLAFYRHLLLSAPPLLKPGGALALEIGTGQRGAITDVASSVGRWQTAQCYKDLSGTERILIFERRD